MSLHERARVLRVVLSVLQKHVIQGSMLCGEMISRANSLVPMGAGLMVGLTSRPYFTRRGGVPIQLLGLRDYSESHLVSRLHRREAA